MDENVGTYHFKIKVHLYQNEDKKVEVRIKVTLHLTVFGKHQTSDVVCQLPLVQISHWPCSLKTLIKIQNVDLTLITFQFLGAELLYNSVCPYVRISVCPEKLTLKSYYSRQSDPIHTKISGNTFLMIFYENINWALTLQGHLDLWSQIENVEII